MFYVFLKLKNKLLIYHAELGLGLLNKVLLLWLADAGKDARLWVEVQHVALEIREEVSKAANAAQAHHTLDGSEKEKRDTCYFKQHRLNVNTMQNYL